MRWASSLSLKIDTDRAVAEGVEGLERTLGEASPDLVLAFPSGKHVTRSARISEGLQERFPGALLIGCSAAGVIGGGHEAEGMTALSLMAATLPGVDVEPVRIDPGTIPGPDVGPGVWRNLVGIEDPDPGRCFVILADPFTSRAEEVLRGLDYAYPACPKIGGLASASAVPGGNAFFLGSETFFDGAVGVSLSGDIRMDTLVAQGGRPVGHSLSVTKCTQNLLFELDERPALEVLQEVYEAAVEEHGADRPPVFFMGIKASEMGEVPGEAEFLIRNIMAVYPKPRAISVSSLLREGQTVRFHLVSARAAEEDLRDLLVRYRDGAGANPAAGALLFSCSGRGASLFGIPDHDSNLFHEVLPGEVPLGGLFCAGEIGPLGGTTYIHGFTSSFGILRSSRNDS